MYPLRIIFVFSLILLIFHLEIGQCYISTPAEWNAYKALYPKNYAELGLTEAQARVNYNFNMAYVTLHNINYRNNRVGYRLKATQFSDLRRADVFRLFAATTPRQATSASPLPPPSNRPLPPTFDPRTDLGLTTTVQDQGYRCASGWAYATAKAIELKQAFEAGGNLAPELLSAQNLIDCAGGGRGCSNQVPQQAFDYLVNNQMPLLLEANYNNIRSQSEPGMCVPKDVTGAATLIEYSSIRNGDDATMKRYVADNYPVIVEYDPTSFEFLHYDTGVFTPPNSARGSHFMTVIGYGRNETLKQDYWLVQNSFGDLWGENGFIRIATTWGAGQSLTKSALLPI